MGHIDYIGCGWGAGGAGRVRITQYAPKLEDVFPQRPWVYYPAER